VIVSRILFYILLLLLPTQLGKHFFFPFSTISGVRVDYLAPTIYLTDIVVLFFILFTLVSVIKHKTYNIKLKKPHKIVICYLFSVICYLLFNSLFVASNIGAALYRFVKVVELVLLGTAIISIRPKLSTSIIFLSIGLFYSSIIAIIQFVQQQSLGGVFWFLGERSFTLATPTIAAISLGDKLLLRPYATFSHPNVLGGFIATVMTFITSSFLSTKVSLKLKYFWILPCMMLGVIALILTFSRLAWIVGFGGLSACVWWMRIRKLFKPKKISSTHLLICIYICIAASMTIPLFWTSPAQSIWQRHVLVQEAWRIASSHPLMGVGLNNFSFFALLRLFNAANFFIFQPVHNIYLLTLAESGIVGFALVLMFIAYLINQLRNVAFIFMIAVLQLLFLGMVDHYLFTLQQGQLLFTIIVALVLSHSHVVGHMDA